MRTVHEPRADLPAADLRPARHSAGAATLQDPRADHLPGVRHRRDAGLGREDARPGGDAAVDARHLLAVPVRRARSRPARAAARTVAAADTPGGPGRTSAVSGKSVSGRVDIGGSGKIKKKKK